MIADTRATALKIVRASDGLELDLEPLQGLWTEALYLKLTDQTNHPIEFTDGSIEALPMPTEHHQAILEWLFLALRSFIEQIGGKVRFAPLRLYIRAGKFREPDILLMRDANDPRRQDRYWLGADLVVEVVSEDDPERDTVEKVADYAEAGIPEYWIVNPLTETITVLALGAEGYRTHGVFQRGEVARSALLDGFAVEVDGALDAR
jgi:Uma2 family endonuclease